MVGNSLPPPHFLYVCFCSCNSLPPESQSAPRCCRINNAASNAYKHKALFELSDADLVQIVETNVLGTMLGCKEVGARRRLRHQACLSCLCEGPPHPQRRSQ